MTTAAKPEAPRVDQFLMAAEERFDRWRALLQATRMWERIVNQQDPNKGEHEATVGKLFQELLQWEDFFAYPGQALLKLLGARVASSDAVGTARLVQSISNALLTHSYRSSVSDWDGEEQSSINLGEGVPGAGEERAAQRPYFEVLVVSPARQTAWQELTQDLRRLRRPQDKFVYEPVFVGTYEDAVLATILNGSVEAVIIYEGIPFASSHNSPILREFLTSHLAASGIDANSSALRPGHSVLVRPLGT